MKSKKRQTKNIFVAWLLLAVLMMPTLIKSFHVCRVELHTANCASTATDHHQAGHDADGCFVCHFTLAPFHSAPSIVLDVVPTLLLSRSTVDREALVLCPVVGINSLRAPPYSL